jgi:hypothetical protein
MGIVKIFTKEFGTNKVLAEPADELTPPFTLTAKQYIGALKPPPIELGNQVQVYYFRLWTIGSTLTTDSTIIVNSASANLTATAWYSTYGTGMILSNRTFAYGKAFSLKTNEFILDASPFSDVVPPNAVLATDPKIAETTNTAVEITAKDPLSIAMQDKFTKWFTLQPSHVNINGLVVKVDKHASVDIIAEYKRGRLPTWEGRTDPRHH